MKRAPTHLPVLLTSCLLLLANSESPAQSIGNCQLGTASEDLDVNNVRARLYNTGGLFYRGDAHVYTVPKSGDAQAIFAAGIWIGGMVDDELRMVAADYGPWELWPGPLDDLGHPPTDCAQFDRLYKVSRQDVLDYEETQVATADLKEWPYDLGAPVLDGDGDPGNYDLAGGDRPRILGDQTIWWVMNDRGNVHNWTKTEALGIEVQVTAFAFERADALNDATFYEYRIINKGGHLVEDTYFSIWVDPDLGNGRDDYVGSDTTLGLGFTYNGDKVDEGGYGEPPPAVGFDFFRGPRADGDGLDNDRDGEVDEEGETMSMTSFVYYDNNDSPQGNPQTAQEMYNYQRAIWRDGVRITLGGSGRGFSEDPVSFMYPGDPVKQEFWSEENTDGEGSRNTPFDRRFLMTAGPFTLDDGDSETITFGVVWAKGADRLDSVTKLREADLIAQAAFDADFQLPPPPDPPRVEFTELDETVVLTWSNKPTDNNYLDQYEVFNPFLAELDVDDKYYRFEGYNVIQYQSERDQTGKLVAAFDLANSIKRVYDVVRIDEVSGDEIKEISADGTDSGVQHSIQLEDLTNYTDYYFGVQAYGYNEHSAPKIIKSAVFRIAVRPSAPTARNRGTIVNPESFEMVFSDESGHVSHVGVGNGTVEAAVVDPSSLNGHVYEVRFYEVDLSDDPEHPDPATNYDIIDVTSVETIFDGRSAVDKYGEVAPQGSHLLTAAGLSWTIAGPPNDALSIQTGGPLSIDGGDPAFVQIQGIGDDDACGPDAGSRFGCDEVGGNLVYGSLNGQRDWAMLPLGDGPEQTIGDFAPNDFEIRVTEEGSYGYHPFDTVGNAIWVPHEAWDIGPTGPFGINDPADDQQLVINLFSDGGGTCSFGFGEIPEDPFLGWPVTDRTYAHYTVEGKTYDDWEAAIKTLVDGHPERCPASPETDGPASLIDFVRERPLQQLVFIMNPDDPDYRDEMIPVGNVIRFLTTKPNLPGDVFTVNTEGFEVRTDVREAAEEALEMMAVVPNPYKGASSYEISNLEDVVRFTNMPEEATIRIFTLAGTLIRTIIKSSPSTSIEWNLRTDEGLPIGSGMYLIHIEVPGVGEKVLKFGAIKKRVQLEFF